MVLLVAVCAAIAICAAPGQAGEGGYGVRIRTFAGDKPLTRAGRPQPLRAAIENDGAETATVTIRLAVPAGLRIESGQPSVTRRLAPGEEARLSWVLGAKSETAGDVRLTVAMGGKEVAARALLVRFLAPRPIRKLAYLPEPSPVQTVLLIGAHHCPLWEADRPEMWAQIVRYPERTPALGFYNQENPEVADWETKWATEHGISFFIYCWYRTSQGGAVRTQFATAIHDALFKSRFQGKMRFTIMWENQARGTSGVADERDLMENLLPYWIENYFRHPSYLKVDGRPLLFIYRPEFLVDDLGGEDKVRAAFDKMRAACKAAGFAGLTLLGEYRGLDPRHFSLMKRLGLDYTFAYCWHVADNPTPQRAIETQLRYIRETENIGILPQVVTVSQGWSGWHNEGSVWHLPPADYERLLREAKTFVQGLPQDGLSGRLLLLDNWNEWGEGHYIAPFRQYGFGYLDAVRRVFAPNAGPHEDLIPEDIGMGPYDRAIRGLLERDDRLRAQLTRRVRKSAEPMQGLVGWWSFDEPAGSEVALDVAGNRLGAEVRDARRAPGIDGRALVCDGGCAVVPSNPRLSVRDGLTIECWVRTDTAGQDNRWLVNRVLSGGVNTGYRLGLLGGKPCFEVPLTDWSHHLTAEEPLPLGRWVHLAGTFDGRTMRLYVDGEERAAMERPGPAGANDFHLVLGSYEVKHRSHFVGLLDEVRIWNRALSSAEVRATFERLSSRAR